METGETYKQLAEIKYSMEDTVKQNFLEPLHDLQNKDLKEVNVHIYEFISKIAEKVMIHFQKSYTVSVLWHF